MAECGTGGCGQGFNLPMNLISSYGRISDSKMRRINQYIQTQLEALKRHAVISNDIHCLHVCKGISMGKNCLLMNIVVTNSKDLNGFYECSKKYRTKELNTLSQIVTDFFKQQQMSISCDLDPKEEVTFKIELQKYVYKNVLEKLNVPASRIIGDNTEPNEENVDACYKKTFICHIPTDLRGNVAGVKIIGDNPEDIQADLCSRPNDMYTINIHLPATCVQFKYQYEVELKTAIGLRPDTNHSRKFKGYTIHKNDGDVIRDVFTKELDDICAHLFDVILYNQEPSGHENLLYWCYQFCRHMTEKEANNSIMSLVSYDLYGEESTIRLALIIYQLADSHSVDLSDTVPPAVARKCTETLKHKKLSDFPGDYQEFISKACQKFYCIGYSGSSYIFDFIDQFWSFFEDEDLLEILQRELREQKAFIHPEGLTQLMVRGKEIMKILTEKKNVVLTEILEIFIRQGPSEFFFELVFEVNKIPSTQTDHLSGILRCIQVYIRDAMLKARRNKHLIDLLRMATKTVEYEDKYSIRDELENTLLELFSFSQDVSVDELSIATVNCLKNSCCFLSAVGQENLVKAIVESESRDVWRLFPLLLNEEKLGDRFMHLDESLLKAWVNQEFRKESSLANEEKIALKIKYIIPVLKSHIVKQREELYNSLEGALAQLVRRFHKMDVINSIPKVDKLCENEPDTICLFKTVVHQYLCRYGGKPNDVIKLFCDRMGQLIVDDRTTAEVISSLICMFFEEETNKSMSEVFIFLTKHVAFLTVLKNRDGTYANLILNNKTYQRIEDKLDNFAELFKLSYLSLSSFKLVNDNRCNAETLLKLFGVAKPDFENKMHEYYEFIQDIEQRLEVFQDIAEHVRARKIPSYSDMKYIISSVSEIKETIVVGSISLHECIFFNPLLEDLKRVTSECLSLHSLVKSEVFWNVSTDAVLESFLKKDYLLTQDQNLLYLRFMFDDVANDEEFDQMEGLNNAADFLFVMSDRGKQLYSEFWEEMDTNPDIKMADVIKMFRNSSVPNEIKIACQNLDRSKDSIANDTLVMIWETKNIQEATNAIESVSRVLDYSVHDFASLKDDIDAFRKLISQNVDNYTLVEIHTMLTNMFALTKILSSVTIDIMACIGESSQLIEFLKSTSVGDLGNLIDAVEKFSESHVQESTVSALIQIKSFLDPLLNPQTDELNTKWIFTTLERQTLSMRDKAKDIPGKIYDCRDNLHNLKSLYNGVANRGQQTKEIIKSVVMRGEFAFTFNLEKEVVNYSAQYKENNIKYEKNESALLDMKSRALLLLNSDRQSRQTESSFNTEEEFRLFIQAIDLCIEISDTLLQLYSTGCNLHSYLGENLPVKTLQGNKELLTEELDCWNSRIKSIRKKYYLMNFITGAQIHSLCSFLETGDPDSEVSDILKFIHPQLSIQHLVDDYQQYSGSTDQIERISKAIHSAYGNLHFFYRTMDCTNCKRKNSSESVQNGRIFFSQLKDNSKYVIKTIFALYHNTTHHFPEPNQIKFCSPDTSWQELELLLNRCKYASGFYRKVPLPLYCLANVEKLQNEVQFKLVDELQALKSGSNFLFALVCRGSKNHPFVDRLSRNMSVVQPMSDFSFRNLLQSKFHHVQTYTSEVAGLGKTSKIITDASQKGLSPKIIHVSGTLQTKSLVGSLRSVSFRSFHFLHIDIGMVNIDDLDGLDVFLFELIVLKYCSAGKSVFYLTTEHISLEIANSVLNTLGNSLHIATSFKRVHLKWNNFDDFFCSEEMNSPVQVVCHYLNAIDQGQIDQMDVKFTGTGQCKPLSTIKCRGLLRKYMTATSDLSHSIVKIFLNVLADQLKKFSCSSFFKVCRIADMIEQNVVPTIRGNLVKCIIEVSREFATRSVNACRTEQGNSYAEIVETSTKDIAKSAVNRTSSMIRWDESNHLIFVFHNQNIQTLSAMYREKDKIPEHVYKMFETQMNKPLPDFSRMNQIELRELLQRVARHQRTPLTKQQLADISIDYALTPDNLLKMVLIMMRVLSRVPVVVMGETGCGKTSLIRYLAKVCDVSFQVFNVNAGINPTDVIHAIKRCNDQCRETLDKHYWLFLDEINTSEMVGLICSIICHRQWDGDELMPNLIIMGACNPYKLRTVDAVKTVGLTGKLKTDVLSKLIYRVLPLPEMMIDYVWDFGSLSEKDEQLYIDKMVEGVLSNRQDLNTLLCKLLSTSQKFVREQETSTCVVSLRDVDRCKILVCWFDDILEKKITKTQKPVEKSIRAIILALAHCYHCRFTDKQIRMKYLEVLSKTAGNDLSTECIHNIIKEEQTDILDRMDLPPGIAKNSALKENIFVLLVCILNRIPVFLVGKPGCSKSLAMQVIRSNLRGKDSKNDFFKTQPQLYCVSFQGSESSRPEGIKQVFEKAENYQNANSKDDVLSVVLLDEIGLADVSKFNPLKVLHSLLEPDGRSRPNVAVVGISNWALDASKMNRAIHLSRPDMDEDELVETAIAITHSFNETVQGEHKGLKLMPNTSQSTVHNIDEDLRLIAQSYISYTRTLQHKHFHGLRDFYSLVKFVARNVAQVNSCKLTIDMKTSIILEGLERNFGGLQHGHSVILEHFQRCLNDEQCAIKSCDALIRENINDVLARHLMVITKGGSLMNIIERNINKSNRESPEIIFGSQFEEDLTDDYSYRILSKIILCMEQGNVLILKDLDYMYGSLYDMLNQNYTRIGEKNNCRVALGPYSNPFCHVDESFRCIVIVEENKIDYSDPPFINRFEKQYLTFSGILNDDHKRLAQELLDWVRSLTVVDGMPFSEHTAFPYFNDELIVSSILYNEQQASSKSILDRCKDNLLWLLRPEVILRLEKVSDQRMVKSRIDIEDAYFDLPIHNGLRHFISNQKKQTGPSPDNKITIIFTSSNIHTDISQECYDWKYISLKIGAFKSEKRLSTTLKQFWENQEQEILLVHCNAAEDEKHLMLTKSLIEKFSGQCIVKKNQLLKRVYIIVHMNIRMLSENAESNTISQTIGSISQINFLSGCQLVLLDGLESPKQPVTVLYQRTLLEVTELYVQNTDNIRNALFWSFTRIKYGEKGRNADSVNAILLKMKECKPFLDILASIIPKHLQNAFAQSDDKKLRWFVTVACDSHALSTCSSLVNALEEHIKSVVVTVLAKVVFGMERIGILDSYFVNDDHIIGRRSLWEDLLSDKKLFCIDEVQNPTGPECYICYAPDLSLKMPFSSIIFDAIEKTKDIFMDLVARAKMKCDMEPDDELPEVVLTEIISQHAAFVEPVVPIVVSNATLEIYPSLCADYITDFYDMFSNNVVSHLNCQWRTDFTKWFLDKKRQLCEEEFYEIVSHFHSTGWLHYSTFCPALQLLELYSDVIKQPSLQVLQVSHATSKINLDLNLSENDGTMDEQNEYQNDSTVNNGLETKEVRVLNEMTPVLRSSSELPANPKFEFLTFDRNLSLETLESFVSTICLQMLKKFSDDSVRHLTKIIIAIARQVSEVPLLEKLRLCDAIATYFIDVHELELSVLRPLVVLLEDTDIDSDIIFTEIKTILNLIDHQQSKTSKSRTMCQYLFRCVLSDCQTTAFRFIFQAITDNIIPEEEYWLLKYPLYTFMESLDVPIIDIISSYDCDQQHIESSLFLMQLKDILSKFKKEKGSDHPFIMIIVDIIQELISLPNDDSFNNLIYKSGIIMQNNSCPLLFVFAVGFLKSAIFEIGKSVTQNGDKDISQLTALNGVMTGLEEFPICHSLKMYFLKILGQTSALHCIQMNCDSLSRSFPCMTDLQWSQKFWSKAMEYNSIAIYVDTDILRIGEMRAIQDEHFENNINGLNIFIKESGDQGRLLVFSLATSEYYTKRYRCVLDDDVQRQADKFYEMAIDTMKSAFERKMLRFLIGTEDFPNDCFQLHENTPFQQYMISTSLVSFYCLMLNRWDGCHESRSMLFKCLLCPSEINVFHKPCDTAHMQQLVDKYALNGGKANFIECSCSNRLVLKHKESSLCPICGKNYEDNTIAHKMSVNSKSDFAGCHYNGSLNSLQHKYFIGHMSTLSYHIYYFMIKGALLGSLQLDTSNTQTVEKLLSVSEIDIYEHLYCELKGHWISICCLTNLNDYELGQLMHRLFTSAIDVLFEDNFQFDHSDAARTWELSFDSRVSEIVRDNISNIHEHQRHYEKVYQLPKPYLESQVRESDCINEYSKQLRCSSLPSLFRLTSKPTRLNFMQLLTTNRQKHPLLMKIMLFEEDLKLPQHLFNLMQWHNITCIKVSCLFNKWECKDMSVREFIDKQVRNTHVKNTFKAFKSSIALLKKLVGDDWCIDIPELNENTKMQECLMTDEKSWLYKLVTKLVAIQNNFIDLCLTLSFDCQNLQFLLIDENSAYIRSVSINELKAQNLISDDNISFDNLLAVNSCADLAYGKGHVIKYDFHNIEKGIIYYLLCKGQKSYIILSGLHFIVFKDELYRTFVSLLDGVKQRVLQGPLPDALLKQIERSCSEAPNLASEFINHLDMILTLLKRTKCQPDTPLSDYVKTIKHMIGHDFSMDFLSSQERSLRVCHIVSLHELLEEISVNQIIECLEHKYMEDLSENLQHHFSSLTTSNISKAETIVKELKKVIYRCIYMCRTTPDGSLHDIITYPSFWTESSPIEGKLQINGKTEDLFDIFPSEVKVCHVVRIVQRLNECIKARRESNVKLNSVIDTWKQKEGVVKLSQGQKAAKKIKTS